MLTVLPDLYLIWKIQRQMVADIFALHGRTAELTATHMLYCLFRHMASHVVRDVVVRAGERALVRQLSSTALSSTLGTLGVTVAKRRRRHVGEPLGAVGGRRGSRRLCLLGHAAGREDRAAGAGHGRAGYLVVRGSAARSRRAGLTMCGRYELHSNPAAIALMFGLAHPPDVQPRYNIAPTTDVPIVRVGSEGQRELVRMRWGLVPRWAKDPSIGARMINARGETIAEKPSFRTAYRRHRCLLPADGFYEWMSRPAGGADAEPARRQPQRIGMADGSPFGMAGLYERWRSESGDVLDSCTIVTTDANSLLKIVHDRMPVIVAPEHYARWLDPANAEVADLIAPYPSSAMAYYPVSGRVNNVRNDDASLIDAVAKAEDEPAAESEPPVHPPEQESLF